MQQNTNPMEVELMAEDEIARLQRKYRHMDMDRRKYQQVIRVSAPKCHKVGLMKMCLKEQQNLRSNLKAAASHNNKRLDDLLIIKLRLLLGEHSKFKDCIVLRKKSVNELEDQIRKIKLQIVDMSVKNQASDNRYQERVQIAQKNVSQLENRLEVQVHRFSCILKKNVKLREEIQHLMKDRELFEKDWDKFFHILELCKKFMHDLIEQTMLIYNQREEYCQKRDVLKQRARSDMQNHSENMQEMQRIMADQNHLHHFLRIKSNRRIPVGAIKKALMHQQKIEIETQRKRDKYCQILENIQKYADTKNMNEIQKQFLVREEYTFSMFSILNNINQESEEIATNIQDLRTRWAEEVSLSETRAKTQAKTLENLRMYHKIATDEVDFYHDKLTTENTKLISIMEGISTLFTISKCDPQSALHLLGQLFPQKRNDDTYATPVADDGTNCPNPIQALVGNTECIMDIHNVDIFLVELEDRITDLIKNAFIYQNDSSVSQQYIIARRKPQNVFKIEDIKTPCPLCLEDSQSILCPTSVTPVLTRSVIENRLSKRSTTYQLLEYHLHTVSKCKMPQAGLVMKKRYMNE